MSNKYGFPVHRQARCEYCKFIGHFRHKDAEGHEVGYDLYYHNSPEGSHVIARFGSGPHLGFWCDIDDEVTHPALVEALRIVKADGLHKPQPDESSDPDAPVSKEDEIEAIKAALEDIIPNINVVSVGLSQLKADNYKDAKAEVEQTLRDMGVPMSVINKVMGTAYKSARSEYEVAIETLPAFVNMNTAALMQSHPQEVTKAIYQIFELNGDQLHEYVEKQIPDKILVPLIRLGAAVANASILAKVIGEKPIFDGKIKSGGDSETKEKHFWGHSWDAKPSQN